MLYNLINSQTARVEFDRIQEQYAEAMINALPLDLALNQDPAEYADVGWESFEVDLEVGAVEVDDLEEAKSRFIEIFARTIREWQEEKYSEIEDALADLERQRNEKLALKRDLVIALANTKAQWC